MKRSYLFAALTVIFFAGVVFAQEEDMAASAAWQADMEAPPTQQQDALLYDETGLEEYETAYGEVRTVDAEAGTIILLSYDYDKDEEIGVLYKLAVDAEFEGAEDLRGVNPGDWASINYHTGEDGSNVADFITVEIEPFLEDIEIEFQENDITEEIEEGGHGAKEEIQN